MVSVYGELQSVLVTPAWQLFHADQSQSVESEHLTEMSL